MTTQSESIQFTVDGDQVEVPDDGDSLLGVLRDRLHKHSAKDGCSPQGQCGCCTVLVDGQPRVACVTPARRVAGRSVTTVDGLGVADRERWANAFCATGASQCGFCTPGIVVRLAGLEAKKPDASTQDVERALAAHLCRCTGWHTITEAWTQRNAPELGGGRNLDHAARRAEIEGRQAQAVSPAVALGAGGFADDIAPPDALVAVRSASGDWVIGDTLHAAREAAGKVQGRRTTLEPNHPIALPEGSWDGTLQTTWVEPAYLETDAAWCLPGEDPVSPIANGGAFGSKRESLVTSVARELADTHQRPVRVLFSREDAVRFGPKRPPVAGGANVNGSGIIRVAATPGIDEAITRVGPSLVIEHVAVPGAIATSADIRAAGWAEAVALLSLARGAVERVTSADGGWAEATVDEGGIKVQVGAGDVLDAVVLRSYCIGAAHMAYSWVTNEALTVDAEGEIHDLTIRSFGVLKAADTPPISVEIVGTGPPVNGSDAVFVAVAAATALFHQANRWPAK